MTAQSNAGASDAQDVRDRRATATLVVELVTEELPPKALKALGAAFADTLFGRAETALGPVRRIGRHVVRDAAPPCRCDLGRSRRGAGRQRRGQVDAGEGCP